MSFKLGILQISNLISNYILLGVLVEKFENSYSTPEYKRLYTAETSIDLVN